VLYHLKILLGYYKNELIDLYVYIKKEKTMENLDINIFILLFLFFFFKLISNEKVNK